MTNRLSRILAPVIAGASLLAIAAGLPLLAQSSETMLRSSFERALGPATTTESQAVAAPRTPLAGSEEFWLTAMSRDPAARFSSAVSLGDRITFTLDGTERKYRVTSVSDLSPAATQIDTRGGDVRLVLVTARDTNDITAPTVRFVMEIANPGAPVAGGQKARTL